MEDNIIASSATDSHLSRTFTGPADNPLRSSQQSHTLQPSHNGDVSVKVLFRRLENFMAKEIRSFWDINTLTEYSQLQQIPRGLRIMKFPTFEFHNDEYKKEWTNTLSACSFKLIQIIIDSRTEELT